MALSNTRLASALAPVIESKIREYVIDSDMTAYPQLTAFAQALAEAIAQEVKNEIVNHAQLTGLKDQEVRSLTNGGGTIVGYLNVSNTGVGGVV